MKWIWIILALAYLLSPYDLIPGLSAIGWVDDIVVLVLLYRYLSKFSRLRNSGSAPNGHGQQHGDTEAREAPDQPARPRTPYETLGVPATATREEIKSAYRRLVNQYHPDKVAHLGDEFRELAEQRFKEIQEAYNRLVQ